ncbi:GNAT family N-acetyltransferase [Flagellatimonas centrodinii]|uniref:GNAT family N-acetyltransferase n=1 Tax=Flagellatimonas centrodinii TaxID=2806210 RepID=UPI001FEE7D79|nr:GNAT family protein [Flagellatimonas centrodinii]ULQ46941.1 GNAT family N-acetyltransferase [Flagellatimonas centrodinii]
MSYSVVCGADDAVAALLTERIGIAEWGAFTTIGVMKDGRLVGGFLYNNFRGYDLDISTAGETGFLTRRTLRACFAYPFEQLNCRRVTALVSKRNRASRRVVSGVGFRLEGVARQAHFTGADLCIYGMLKNECRWINGK